MKIHFVKSVAFIVAVAFLSTAVVPRAEASLVPAPLTQTGQTVNSNEDAQTIQKTLESKVLRAKLHSLGLSDAEINSRLSRLSDAQRHQLASQIRAVNPAGDGLIIGLLVVVVLVLLIIYLFKRI